MRPDLNQKHKQQKSKEGQHWDSDQARVHVFGLSAHDCDMMLQVPALISQRQLFQGSITQNSVKLEQALKWQSISRGPLSLDCLCPFLLPRQLMLQENLATLHSFLPGPILSLPCSTYLSDNSHAILSSFSSLSGPCDFSLDRHGNHSGQHPYSPAPPPSLLWMDIHAL